MSIRKGTLTIFVMMSIMLYNALLIGGGRGPFALYEEHWACHCDDLTTTQDYNAILNDRTHALDQKNLFIVIDGEAVPANSMIWIFGDSNDAVHNMCKRKAPLKYLSLISSGTIAPSDSEMVVLPGVNYSILHTHQESFLAIRSGYRHIAIKPPTA